MLVCIQVEKMQVVNMKKKSKPTLLMGLTKISSLKDLKTNFIFDDVLTYYQTGQLVEWLDAFEYQQLAKQVKAIQSKDTLEILKALIAIFEIDIKGDSPEAVLAYWNNQRYQAKFELLLRLIYLNNEDVSQVKELINQLITNFADLYEQRKLEIFELFVRKAHNAAFAIINNPKAFKPYMRAILMYNHVLKNPLTKAEFEQLCKLNTLIADLMRSDDYSHVDVRDNFEHIRIDSIEAEDLYGTYRPTHTLIDLKKILCLYSKRRKDLCKDGIDFTDLVAPLALVLTDCALETDLNYMEDIFLTVDISSYGITAKQWEKIAANWPE